MVDIKTSLIMAGDVQPNPGPQNEKEKGRKLMNISHQEYILLLKILEAFHK